MSATAPQPRKGDDSIAARIKNLIRTVEQSRDDQQRRKKRTIFLGAALLSICGISMGLLTKKVSQLDAQALTGMGREQLERELPKRLDLLESHLAGQAPELCAQLLYSSLELIPRVREEIQNNVEARLEAVLATYEPKLEEVMVQALAKSKLQLKEGVPGETDEERLVQLVAAVGEHFKSATRVAHSELYPQYSAELNRVKSFLVDLQTKDASQITHREKIQRDLIQTLLQLMARERGAAD